MKASDLSRLVTAKTERRPIALVTDLGSNQQALFEVGSEAPVLTLSPAARTAVAEALAGVEAGLWLEEIFGLSVTSIGSKVRRTAVKSSAI